MSTATIPETLPDQSGHFGTFGGRFVPETLVAALDELTAEYEAAKADPEFRAELDGLLSEFCGRETPLYFAERWTEKLGGAKIYLKREDLLHTGAHKINNALGQILLAKRLGKKRIIAETGAGQHGVATATVAARFGLECIVYMGAIDMERQHLNVVRMRLLGAEVRGGEAGQRTLKEHHPDCRIKVCDRNKTGSVRVIITGPSKRHTDACFREGEQMMNEILKDTPRSERANPAKPLTLEENFEEFVRDCKYLVRIRELMGCENHDCCPEVMQLIAHRESQGITDHSEIGKYWQPPRPMVWLDDIVGYEVPVDDWAEYSEIHWRVQQENPHLKVV